MGYRSDVAIGFCFKDEEEKVSFLGAVRVAGDEYMWKAVCEYSYVAEDRLMYLHLEGVKWYEGYEDVDAHHRLLDMAEEREIPSVFVRIGEEHDDSEHSERYHDRDIGRAFDDFGMTRQLRAPEGGVPVINKGEKNDNQS